MEFGHGFANFDIDSARLSGFDERFDEVKDDANGGEVFVRKFVVGHFGVENRRIGNRSHRRMVIDDERVDVDGLEHFDFFVPTHATIDGDEQIGFARLECGSQCIVVKAMTVFFTAWQEIAHICANVFEELIQERRRGHAVDVVVAKYEDRFAVFVGSQTSFDGFGHVIEQHRIGEIVERWLEKPACLIWRANAAIIEHAREQLRFVQIRRQSVDRFGIDFL